MTRTMQAAGHPELCLSPALLLCPQSADTAVSAEKSPLSPKFSLTPAATYGTMYELTI